jgi:phospholipase/carboxylesterase
MPDDDFYRLRRSKPSGPGQLRVPGAPRRPCPVFLPAEYQPKYPYPLVLLLHPPGSDEWETLARVPYLSNRNYIVLCPRGSRPITPNSYGQTRWSWTEGHPRDIGYLQRLLDAACQRWSTSQPRLYVIGVAQAAVLAERLATSYHGAISGLALLHPTAEHIQQGTFGQAIRSGLRLFLGAEVRPPLARSAIRRLAAHYRRLGAVVQQESWPFGSPWYLQGLRRVNRWIMDTMPAAALPASRPAFVYGLKSALTATQP